MLNLAILSVAILLAMPHNFIHTQSTPSTEKYSGDLRRPNSYWALGRQDAACTQVVEMAASPTAPCCICDSPRGQRSSWTCRGKGRSACTIPTDVTDQNKGVTFQKRCLNNWDPRIGTATSSFHHSIRAPTPRGSS